MERPAPAIRLQECRPHAFQRWGREGVFERLLQEAGQLVEEHGEYRLYEGFPDAAFCPARGGGDGIGRTKVGKGVKILIAVDARGLPIAVQSCSARPYESALAQGWFDFMLTKEVAERVVGEKAWESDALDRAFAARGMELMAPAPEQSPAVIASKRCFRSGFERVYRQWFGARSRSMRVRCRIEWSRNGYGGGKWPWTEGWNCMAKDGVGLSGLRVLKRFRGSETG